MPDVAVEVMVVAAWYAAMISSLNEASEAVVGSYQYDHEGLTDVLERRLRGHAAFDCVVLLDREMYGLRTPYHQRSRLERLRRAGATVVLCRGTPSTGSFHAKAVVTDRRTAFIGSANMTAKSLRNGELCLRLRGPPVLNVLQFLQTERAGGQELQ
jgi:phosphatidylserine/phosphatidylglycerophosphate/cardiolipin synthase-like enzyme